MKTQLIDPRIANAQELLTTQRYTLQALANAVGLSPSYLQKQFTHAYGISPAQFLAQQKLANFKKNLKRNTDVNQDWVDSDFGSSSRVYENGAAKIGMLPTDYKKGGLGLHIVWTVCNTELGLALIAATERGICAIALAVNEQTLVNELQTEFPNAQLERVDENHRFIEKKVQQIARALAGKSATVAIDLLGTAFQHKVWQALMLIPKGQTHSYAELAELINMPKAARAVARACASNKVAILVPCHRIIRGDGSLGGYRWGLPLKQHVLDFEMSIK